MTEFIINYNTRVNGDLSTQYSQVAKLPYSSLNSASSYYKVETSLNLTWPVTYFVNTATESPDFVNINFDAIYFASFFGICLCNDYYLKFGSITSSQIVALSNKGAAHSDDPFYTIAQCPFGSSEDCPSSYYSFG